jgi:formylglycine-generating enzyme required for sulfatase activity
LLLFALCLGALVAEHPRALAGEPSAGQNPPLEKSTAHIRPKTKPSNEPEPKKGQIWTDPVTKMEFVYIPGGCFTMGTPADEEGREPDEGPGHEVCVDGFWMGKTPVTNAQYRKYDRNHNSRTYFGHDLNGDNQPVVYVSWEQAREFARWLTRKNHALLGDTGRSEIAIPPEVLQAIRDGKDLSRWLDRQKTGRHSFFLPTEAEWEYACRAGTESARFWGNDSGRACGYANVADQSASKEWRDWRVHGCNDGWVVTSPAGSFKPNPFGLHDMLGNVWEWCLDWYSTKYEIEPKQNPTGPPLSGIGRQVRGGSWDNDPAGVRCGNRSHATPRFIRYNIGFRLIRTR